MPPSYFPLRWESTGDQWWYASPIDWAAANGLYDLVRELLHLDTNLLIKLTSLRRIRRLETVWDDEEQFDDVAKCRSQVAQKLLLACETKRGHNSLIRAGYGGWLLYTAASAGDVDFIKELLGRDPLLVFGEGEYGVTDIFYAAARSKNCEVFRLLLDYAVSPRCSVVGGDLEEELGENESVFRLEMMNRAVHASARGGNLEILKELLGDCSDVFGYRDVQGSTILHTASGRGQIEVVKYLVASFDMIMSADNQGNTALHVAAYRGYLLVLKVLALARPSLTSTTNNYGDTFLHMAVAGFRAPGFRRVDRQIELMKQLANGEIVNIEDLVNVKNNDGRTALYMAIVENIQSDLVELLMKVPSINLNVRDVNGMTPLDLLRRRPKSASSEILIKQLISAGGISNSQDNLTRSAIVSQLRGHGTVRSPGTSFRIPDAEIFLYTGVENSFNSFDASFDTASIEESTCLSEASELDSGNSNDKKSGLKFLLRWAKRRERKPGNAGLGEDSDGSDLCRKWDDSPIPLRQVYSRSVSLPNNKRTVSVRSVLPSPSTRKRFTAGLTHGVIHASPLSSYAGSSMSSPNLIDKQKGEEIAGPSCSNNQELDGKSSGLNHKQSSFDKKLMNQYFCFGAQGLAVEDSMSCVRPFQRYNRSSSLVT